MRISKLRIENLRSFKDQTIIFDKYNCFVGENGCGKSTVLYALNIFFKEQGGVSTNVHTLHKEDFHRGNTSVPIKVTVTFTELSNEAKEKLAHYVRGNELILCAKAVYDESIREAVVEQFGLRRAMREFADFFETYKNKSSKETLVSKYESLREKFKELPDPGTKDGMASALQEYESRHPELCEVIESSDKLYGIKGTGILTPFVQWIYVPAVKDAVSEDSEGRNTALGQLLARTIEARSQLAGELEKLKVKTQDEYANILGNHERILDEVSSELNSKIQLWAHPDASLLLKWKADGEEVKIDDPIARVSAKEGIFEGRLPRFGHGLQRSFLFAILHILSNTDAPNAPTLILGCEEPELYQHPPQHRHLASVLRKLSDGNSQIVLCTHSPYFVSGKDFEDVRFVRKTKDACETKVEVVEIEEISRKYNQVYDNNSPELPVGTRLKIHQSLQGEINEMFFAKNIIFVEGEEDEAYIVAYMNLLDKWQEFRRLGCHIVRARGKGSIVRPLIVAKSLEIPSYVVFDADNHKRNNHEIQHKRDNMAILRVLGNGENEPFPNQNLVDSHSAIWKEEIAKAVKEELSKTEFENILDQTRNKYGAPGDIDKNSLFIADALEAAWNKGIKSELLTQLCEKILAFASRQT